LEIDSFKGISFHSARRPKGLDVKGKRFAVTGTGSPGSQITGTIHPLVKQVTVFQQRAQRIMHVNDRPVSEEEKKEIYQNYDGI
jgi:cation diffusion facilitator CzcD-associated flavoprotein CzcO